MPWWFTSQTKEIYSRTAPSKPRFQHLRFGRNADRAGHALRCKYHDADSLKLDVWQALDDAYWCVWSKVVSVRLRGTDEDSCMRFVLHLPATQPATICIASHSLRPRLGHQPTSPHLPTIGVRYHHHSQYARHHIAIAMEMQHHNYWPLQRAR